MSEQNVMLFEKMDVRRAVIALALPTVISQLIGVVYNMSDTFWIGQLNDPAQVAASTICMPLFLFTMCISNIFGVGGASLISRCLGQKDYGKARSAASFCVWTAGLIAVTYGVLVMLGREILLPLVGATEDTYNDCYKYLIWTVGWGSMPGVMNGLMGQLIRAEGYPKEASFGMILGVSLNMILDPIFIFMLDMQIAGAALATVVSMCVGLCYFAYFIYRHRKESVLSFKLKDYSAHDGIAKEVFLVGFPSSILTLMATASNVVLNVLMAGYSTAAIAGMGIAKRIDILTFAVANGMAQGVLPLIGYNFAAKNFERMRAAIKTTFLYSLILSGVAMLYLFFGASQIVHFFINDPETVDYGKKFLKIICVGCPCVSVTMLVMTIFQAMGKKVQPVILSVVRRGGFEIPLMFGLNVWIGVVGVAWAIPIQDIAAMIIAILLFLPVWFGKILWQKA